MMWRLERPLALVGFNQDGTKIAVTSRDHKRSSHAVTFRIWSTESAEVLSEFVTGTGYFSFFSGINIVHLSQNELNPEGTSSETSLEYWNCESGLKEHCVKFPDHGRVGEWSIMHAQPSADSNRAAHPRLKKNVL